MNIRNRILVLLCLTLLCGAARGGENSLVPDEALRKDFCAEYKKHAINGGFSPQQGKALSSICGQSVDESKTWLGLAQLIAGGVRETCSDCLFERILHGEEVPYGFSTYVTFVNPARRGEPYGNGQYLKLLYEVHKNFGEAIGDRRAAIWFESALGNNDSERARRYCDALDLSYNDGPYIVLSSKSPDLWREGDVYFYLKLGGLEPSDAIVLLNTLEQQIRKEEISKAALIYEEVSRRLITVLSSDKAKQIVGTFEKMKQAVE